MGAMVMLGSCLCRHKFLYILTVEVVQTLGVFV